ncbi:MAG TPA: hypothetical protein VGM81_12420 [Burkholderiaceae bacterium]|jgi:hypothetical protein
MTALTPLGIFHTAISVVALLAGAAALIRNREISPRSGFGQLYLWTTVITCLTGFGIFQHGGWGKPHQLGVITLITLAIAFAAGRGMLGRASRYVETVGYSLTFFFHMIPAWTETLTRLPSDAPVFATAEDPRLQALYGLSFIVFLIGAAAQVRSLRAQQRQRAGGASTVGFVSSRW